MSRKLRKELRNFYWKKLRTINVVQSPLTLKTHSFNVALKFFVKTLIFFLWFSLVMVSGKNFCFFLSVFPSQGREGTIFYSTLPLPTFHEHWDIYLQLCMWDDYHKFLIATLVFTRLILLVIDEIYNLIELPFEWLIDDAMFVSLLDELVLGFVTAISHWKPVDLNSHQLSPLDYKRNY